MIESGEKLEEYRGDSATWCSRLLTQEGWRVLRTGKPDEELDWLDNSCKYNTTSHFHKYEIFRAQRGYTGVWLERKIKRIRWGTPRPEWSGDTVTGPCFIIELEAKA
jgi:hypothetical protein